MGNNHSDDKTSKFFQQISHVRLPTSTISLPAAKSSNAQNNVLCHPDFPFPTFFILSTEAGDSKTTISLSKVQLKENALVLQEQILSLIYNKYEGPLGRGFVRTIPNGFEMLMSGSSKNPIISRCQWLFDGTTKEIKNPHKMPLPNIIESWCFVKDTYYWIGYEQQNAYLCYWNVDTNAHWTSPHPIPSSTRVFQLDENTIFLPEQGSSEARVFDIPSKKLLWFPLLSIFPDDTSQNVHLSDSLMAFFESEKLLLFNKKTRQTRLFYTGRSGAHSVQLLPRASNDAPFELICESFKTTLPASLVCELGFSVAKDATIQTANGSVAVHKLILAARIPKSLDNGELLNWSFASKSAAEKVVQFLYSGWIDVGAADADLKHISLIAKHTSLNVLTQFLQSIVAGTDAKLNDVLQDIGRTRKKPKNCDVDGVSYETLFDAYVAMRENKKATAITLARKAAEKFPNSLLVERFVKSVEGCSFTSLQQSLGNLERDLATLVFNPVLSDIDIVLSGKKYPAHSIFFKESELVNTMKELNNDEEKLVIDLDKLGLVNTEEELKQLLVFAYTGTLSLPDSMSVATMIRLAGLGFFFGFTELQQGAETWFVHHADTSNAKELLAFAVTYNCDRLIPACQRHLSPSPLAASNLTLNLSDFAGIKGTERYEALAKHFRIQNNSFKYENGELDIIAPRKLQSSMNVLNYELPYETGFKVGMNFETSVGHNNAIVQILLCSELPSLNETPKSLLQLSSTGFRQIVPHFNSKSYEAVPITAPLSVEIVCVPMKYVEPTMDNHLLIATINKVSHSFHVKFNPENKYFVAIRAENMHSTPVEVKLKSFHVEFNSNAEKEWVPAIMDMPLTCFRSCCNQVFTLKTNNDMACNAHISYATKVDPYNSFDYDCSEEEKTWSCCNKERTSTGCYVGRHGLAKTF